MRVCILLLALLAVQLFATVDAGIFSQAQYTNFFTKFISTFKKQYTQARLAATLKTFQANLDRVTQFNAANKPTDADSMQLGLTEFADLSPAEFASLYFGEKTEDQIVREKAEASTAGHGQLVARAEAAEASTLALVETETGLSSEAAAAAEAEAANEFAKGFDWTAQNKVMIPRHQGSCGSCYAFTVAATIESARLIKGNAPAYISVQGLIDCARYPCSGCSGGRYSCGYSTALKGYYDEKTAKYTGKADSSTLGSLKRFVSAPECAKLPSTPLGKINGVRSVRARSDAAFIEGVKKNPMYVGIDAAGLQLYKGGIVTAAKANCSNSFNNHAVMMVGYGSANGVNYYKIRNSWGKTWGERGYFRIEAGAQNTCGILRQGHYPIL